MEHDRTRQALDELADLLLTGGQGADASAQSPEKTQDTHKPLDKKSNATKNQPPAGNGAADLAGPEPIRLEPKAPHRQPAQTDQDAQDTSIAEDTPDLKLSEPLQDTPTQPTQPTQPAPAAVAVEAVLLGNLPGLSGPWLSQYAQRQAQAQGRVLVLHVDEAGFEAELFEAEAQAGLDVEVGSDEGLTGLLERLVRLEQGPVARVLVHVDEQAIEQMPEVLGQLPRWTLLSGADDAAVAAGVRLIGQGLAADARPNAVGLMVVGSGAERAEQALAGLQQGLEDGYDGPVELVGEQRRMMPVQLRQLGRFEADERSWSWVWRWLAEAAYDEPATLRRLAEAGADVEAQPQEPEAMRGPEDEVRETEQRAMESKQFGHVSEAELSAGRAGAQQRRTPQAGGPSAHWGREYEPPSQAVQREQADAESAREQNPSQASQTASAHRQDAPDLDLSAFVTGAGGAVAGGVALEARCPQQRAVQMLADEQGRLHLLCRHEPEQGTDDVASLQAAVMRLLEAQHWSREHRELIALTQRQVRFDPQAEPVLHLFTHRADLATALAARLGAGVRLHLLTRVQVGDQTSWYCTALS